MIKRIVIINVIISALFLCLACTKENVLTSDTNMEKGKKIIFEFGSNPTTGYDWYFEFGNEEKNIELVTEDYEGKADENRLGAGGIKTFVFKGIKPGKQSIIFTYKRNWEGGDIACDVVYEVEIDKNLDIKCLEKHIGKIKINSDLDTFPDPSFSE